MGSLVLTFVALGWATVISAVCFFYGAGLWPDLLGRERAFYGALLMFLVCLGSARLLLRLADRMLEPYSGPFDERAYRKSPRDTFYSDWQRYAGDIMRNRRYAFYARTRQWDKLAALEAQGAGPVAAPEPLREPLQPLRTSVGKDLSAEEVKRGARRNSGRAAQRVERWTALDEDEYDYDEDE